MQAVKDALAQLEPQIDEIVVSTHGAERSGWMRRDVVQEIDARRAGASPSSTCRGERDGGETNVLVIANQTVSPTSCSTGSASAPRKVARAS